MSESVTITSNLENYDEDFFAQHVEGSYKSAQKIVPHLLKIFPQISSVVDFGCGTGAWLSVFKQSGIDAILGLDGGSLDSKSVLIDASEYRHVNFDSATIADIRADLAMSLEVAEHLDEQNAKGFVSNLCNASDLILFSAAIPGQGGVNHVNERWGSYWAEQFNTHNYKFFDVIRPHIWLDESIEWWYRQNIFIVVNRANHDLLNQLARLSSEQPPMLDLVHPKPFEILQTETRKLAVEIEKLRNSRSWRLTRPLRITLRRLGGLFS